MEIKKETLQKLYRNEEQSAAEIAKSYHCSKTSILRRMGKYGIPRRSHSEVYEPIERKSEKKNNFNKEKLEELFYEKQLSKREISRLLKVPYKTIEYWMNKYGIKSKTVQITKDGLEDLYIRKRLSMSRIASMYNVTSATILNKLRKYKLKTRTSSEAGKNNPHPARRKIKIGKEALEKLYWEETLSQKEIGDILNCDQTTVAKWMKIWSIKSRTYKESATPITHEKQQKMQQCLHRKPTRPEQCFIEIIKKNQLPYRYTGNGDVMIGAKNPDFFNTNGNKVVIEIFGEVYHSPLFTFMNEIGYSRTYKGTMEHYKKYGLKCIVFWDRDVLRDDAEEFVLKTLQEEGGI